MSKTQERICNMCMAQFEYITKPGRPSAQCSVTCRLNARKREFTDRYCTNKSCLRQYDMKDPLARPPYFCSVECNVAVTMPGRSCHKCNFPIPDDIKELQGSSYCSQKCYAFQYAGRKCQHCQDLIDLNTPSPWQRPLKYCSDKCRNAAYGKDGQYAAQTRQANEDYLVALRQHFRTYASNGKLGTLPVRSGDFPFHKASGQVATNNWKPYRNKPPFHTGLNFTEELQSAFNWDKLVRKMKTLTQDPTTAGLTLHLLGIQSSPTLAQVLPWLNDAARAAILKTDWLEIQRRYGRKLSPTATHTDGVEKVRALRDRMWSGTFLKPPKKYDMSAITFTAKKLYMACQNLNRLVQPPDFTDYLTPTQQALVSPLTYVDNDGDLVEQPAGDAYVLKALLAPLRPSAPPKTPRGISKEEALNWWKSQSHPIDYANWFVNALHPGVPRWMVGIVQYEENY